MSLVRKDTVNHKPGLIYKKEVYEIIGAAIEVHSQLGFGFLEKIYEEALLIEFKERNIPFQNQVSFLVTYKGNSLKKSFYVDLIAFGKIIIELKAIKQISNNEKAQLINYLRVTGCKLGLIINFGSTGKLEWQRIIV